MQVNLCLSIPIDSDLPIPRLGGQRHLCRSFRVRLAGHHAFQGWIQFNLLGRVRCLAHEPRASTRPGRLELGSRISWIQRVAQGV